MARAAVKNREPLWRWRIEMAAKTMLTITLPAALWRTLPAALREWNKQHPECQAQLGRQAWQVVARIEAAVGEAKGRVESDFQRR